MHDRLGHAGAHLTEKQSHKLYEVLSRSRLRRVRYPFGTPYRWRPRNPAPYELRYLWRRLTRLLIIAIILITPTALYSLYSDLLAQRPIPASSPIASEARMPPSDWNTTMTGSIRVIDGDTVDVSGEHFRLVGLNTPETFEPRCALELALGTQAKERLKQLLAAGSPRLVKVPCACPPGTEGTKRCNYGRSCAVLSVDGRDVADTLIGEGLAVTFRCSGTGCPPTPRPWCG